MVLPETGVLGALGRALVGIWAITALRATEPAPADPRAAGPPHASGPGTRDAYQVRLVGTGH
ncbi:hypothetical protein ACFZB9_18800 [Kitasatospora sp. NPDC008050]|uniref:hypothetical protein n=1 Tax=Kitasatospora sp. NPDC008050 TaxID=3364021 RepID=UPI0036DFE258